jgi:GTP-binding protein
MIIGTNSRSNDLVVNPCKAKALSNMRTKATDEKSQLEPPKILTLEQALEFIDSTELLEVTPQNLRLRKKSLNEAERRRSGKEEAAA